MGDKSIGIVAKIAWSETKWKGFDEKGFENKEMYGDEYVKETGIAHEWWNFYDFKFDDNYYGYVRVPGSPKEPCPKAFRDGKPFLVIFVSRNIYTKNKNWYFVGFYADAECNKEQNYFELPVRCSEIIDEKYRKKISEIMKTIENEDYKKSLEGIYDDKHVEMPIKAPKDKSIIFRKFIPIEDIKEVIGAGFGQNPYGRIGPKIDPGKIKKLLENTRKKFESLLENTNSQGEIKEINTTIEKINYVLKKYFSEPNSQEEEKMPTLNDYFTSRGYHFPEHRVAQFYTALKTKGFVILSGLSGTGKTKMALEFASLLEEKEIKFPQILAAWGRGDTEDELLMSLNKIKEQINDQGYASMVWGPAGKAKITETPFIFWTTYNKKVQAGFLVENRYFEDDLERNKSLYEYLKSGYKWCEEVYNGSFEDHIDGLKERFPDVVIFEIKDIYIKEIELSNFIKENQEELKSPPQSGFSAVKIKNIPDDIPQSFIFNHRIFLPVRPDWRDSKALLGYYNPIAKEYEKTPLLEFILNACDEYREKKGEAMPYFIILDEMNLAHVEYYFADFLSVLESGRDREGFTKESIKLHSKKKLRDIPSELKLPPNLYVIGTVNIDETTYMFSPKVLDRAFTIEFYEVELDKYRKKAGNKGNRKEDYKEFVELRNEIIKDMRDNKEKPFLALRDDRDYRLEALKNLPRKHMVILEDLIKSLEPYNLHFGYRIVDEIATFFMEAGKSWKEGIVKFRYENEIFDLALLMKVLPKFHGNRKKLEFPLFIVLYVAKKGETEDDLSSKRLDDLISDVLEEKEGELVDRITKELKNADDNDKYKFKHTAKKALRMLRQLYEVGFASFS